MDNYIEFKKLTTNNQEEVERFCAGQIKGILLPAKERVIEFRDWNDREVEISVGDVICKTQFGVFQVPVDYYLYRTV